MTSITGKILNPTMKLSQLVSPGNLIKGGKNTQPAPPTRVCQVHIMSNQPNFCLDRITGLGG